MENMILAYDMYVAYEDTFKSFGFECVEAAGKISATFSGKIDGKDFKLRLVVTPAQ